MVQSPAIAAHWHEAQIEQELLKWSGGAGLLLGVTFNANTNSLAKLRAWFTNNGLDMYIRLVDIDHAPTDYPPGVQHGP